MSTTLALGDVTIEIVHKAIKNLHLSVHPPMGRVRIAAPPRMKIDLIRLYAISKLPWIRNQQAALRAQARERPREYTSRESHEVWGKRYLLRVVETDAAPTIELGQRFLVMTVRPGASALRRHEQMSRWYRDQLRVAADPIIERWAKRLKVEAPPPVELMRDAR